MCVCLCVTVRVEAGCGIAMLSFSMNQRLDGASRLFLDARLCSTCVLLTEGKVHVPYSALFSDFYYLAGDGNGLGNSRDAVSQSSFRQPYVAQ